MRKHDLAKSLGCAAIGGFAVYLLRLVSGGWPDPVLVFGVTLASVGAMMVLGRFSRLGPFNGELGSPWFENELRELISYETNRAMRYGRELAVAAVRGRTDSASWEPVIRSVDRAFECRRGWLVFVLPETSRQGAMALLRRLNETAPLFQAVMFSVPGDVTTAREACSTLLGLLTRPGEPGTVFFPSPSIPESKSIVA